jgi:hypothetical protein
LAARVRPISRAYILHEGGPHRRIVQHLLIRLGHLGAERRDELAGVARDRAALHAEDESQERPRQAAIAKGH